MLAVLEVGHGTRSSFQLHGRHNKDWSIPEPFNRVKKERTAISGGSNLLRTFNIDVHLPGDQGVKRPFGQGTRSGFFTAWFGSGDWIRTKYFYHLNFRLALL